jgi:hypothetical protein
VFALSEPLAVDHLLLLQWGGVGGEENAKQKRQKRRKKRVACAQGQELQGDSMLRVDVDVGVKYRLLQQKVLSVLARESVNVLG